MQVPTQLERATFAKPQTSNAAVTKSRSTAVATVAGLPAQPKTRRPRAQEVSTSSTVDWHSSTLGRTSVASVGKAKMEVLVANSENKSSSREVHPGPGFARIREQRSIRDLYKEAILSEPPSPATIPQRSSPAPFGITLTEFVILDMSASDVDYASDVSVTRPNQCEDVHSDDEKPEDVSDKGEVQNSDEPHYWSDSELSSSPSSLAGDLEHLQLRDEREAFEQAQRNAYRRRKSKWRKGGNHKRSHAQSVGSDSEDNEDVMQLDNDDVIGTSARRLRRRTDDLQSRPNRNSLLFQDPPNETEELMVEAQSSVLDTDDDMVLPLWMYQSALLSSDTSDEDDEPRIKEAISLISLSPINLPK